MGPPHSYPAATSPAKGLSAMSDIVSRRDPLYLMIRSRWKAPT